MVFVFIFNVEINLKSSFWICFRNSLLFLVVGMDKELRSYLGPNGFYFILSVFHILRVQVRVYKK